MPLLHAQQQLAPRAPRGETGKPEAGVPAEVAELAAEAGAQAGVPCSTSLTQDWAEFLLGLCLEHENASVAKFVLEKLLQAAPKPP